MLTIRGVGSFLCCVCLMGLAHGGAVRVASARSGEASATRSAAAERSAANRSVTLDAPRYLTVLDYTPRVVLAWTYDGALTTGFEVERAIVAGAPNARADRFTRIGAPGRDTRTFRDPTSHAGMTYVYRVRAVGTGTMSPYSKDLIVKVYARKR